MSISIVIPVYQNADTLTALYAQLKAQLASCQLVFVNDASTDDSEKLLQEIARSDPRVQIVTFKKNGGQHAAVLKGFEMCQGAVICVLDADLQDPPQMIPQLVEKLSHGYEVVFAGRYGKYESFPRLATSKVFKWLMHKICNVPRDAGMFFVIKRSAAEKLHEIPMCPPFVPALIGLANLRSTSLPFVRPKRAGGASAYTSKKRLMIGFSAMRQALKVRSHMRQTQSQIRYYAQKIHPNIAPNNYPFSIQKHLMQVARQVPLDEKLRILEVGCGMGRFTIPLAERGLKIEGLDLSPHLLENLKGHNIRLHCENLLATPEHLHGQFDLVLGFFILHHLPDMKRAFQAVFRLLKPTGRALFVEPNPYNLLYYLQILLHPKMRWKNERFILLMRKTLLRKATQEAGFTNFQLKRYGFFPPFLAHRWGFSSVEALLERARVCEPFLPYQLFALEKEIPRSEQLL